MNALEVIQIANKNALVNEDETRGVVSMIEDVGSVGKLYRIEIQSNRSGNQAVAFIRYTPDPIPSEMKHLNGEGQLDLGKGWLPLQESTASIAEAIFRARFWCTSHHHFVHNQHLIGMGN